MGKHWFNKNNLGFLLSTIVGLGMVFLQGGIKMNPLSYVGIALMAAGILGYFIVNLKPRKPEHPDIIDGRKRRRSLYLPKLQDVIDNIIARKQELAVIAGDAPLNTYYKQYISGHLDKRYNFYCKVMPANLAIIAILEERKFYRHNTYLEDLEEHDTVLLPLQNEYKTFYTQNHDALLRKYIRELWRQAHRTYSMKSIIHLAKQHLDLKDSYKSSLYSKEPIEDERLHKAIIKVKKRIEELTIEGVPNE
jgi:hypothetical protein